jgi:hypothetical protein
MPFKKTPSGDIASRNGLPIFVGGDGKESVIDPDASTKQIETLTSRIVANSFAQSKFVGESLRFPAEVIQARFGQQFELEDDGSIVGYDNSGAKIWSRLRPGEAAGFDEALETIVEGYAHKDQLMRADGAQERSAGKVLTRHELDAMPPIARAKHFSAGGTVIDSDDPAPRVNTGPASPAPGSTIKREVFEALNPRQRSRAMVVDGVKVID